MLKHTYHLLGEVTRHDLETLHRVGVNFVVFTDDYPIDTYEFQITDKLLRNQEVQITATDSKQQAWLKLCFGDRIQHFSTQYEF